ncbi:MAG: enoyl-CoA hydratase [Frankiales bacterium]|nr:enoyl-CoA hydratase [Frankiales bacterium]
MRLTRDGEVFLLDLGDTENRFDPTFLDAVTAALDEVAATEGPRALVTTATGKFWSNGLDLDWLFSHPDDAGAFVDRVHGLFARVLTLPVPTVAAVQGHCFAAGGMLALAHDWRVMRSDRGFFCLPEVDIQIPFTVGMGALIQAKLTPQAATEAMTTGHRYGGAHAVQAGVADVAVAEDEVLAAALAKVRPLTGKAGPTLGTIKERMYAGVVATLV